MSCTYLAHHELESVLVLIMIIIIVQVHVRVEIPTKLSNDERKIVEELQEIQSKKPVKKKGFSIF